MNKESTNSRLIRLELSGSRKTEAGLTAWPQKADEWYTGALLHPMYLSSAHMCLEGYSLIRETKGVWLPETNGGSKRVSTRANYGKCRWGARIYPSKEPIAAVHLTTHFQQTIIDAAGARTAAFNWLLFPPPLSSLIKIPAPSIQ